MTAAAVVGPVAAKPRLRDRIDAMPTWLGATIGVVAIVAIWWIASAVLFQASEMVLLVVAVVRRLVGVGTAGAT